MHTLSKKDWSSDELETLRRSRNPAVVVTANWEVQTNEEAQVYVYDLGLFVTVQLLEDTPAVQSLGKLCEENGHSCEWSKRFKTTADSKWEEILMQNGSFRTSLLCQVCPPDLVLLRLQHRQYKTCCLHQVQPQSEVADGHQEIGARQTQ